MSNQIHRIIDGILLIFKNVYIFLHFKMVAIVSLNFPRLILCSRFTALVLGGRAFICGGNFKDNSGLYIGFFWEVAFV